MRTSTTWKPGHSGNPRGRPESPSSKVLRKALEARLEIDAEAIVGKLVELAKEGVVSAARIIFEFAMAKPSQSIIYEDVTRHDEARSKVADRILSADPDIQRALLEVIHDKEDGEN